MFSDLAINSCIAELMVEWHLRWKFSAEHVRANLRGILRHWK